jgi:hypothetical protein
MKRALLPAILLLAACASSKNAVVSPLPEIDVVQVYGPADIPYSRGQDSVMAEYAFRVRNGANVPITLRRIEMSSLTGGTIALRREDRAFNRTVNPGSAEVVSLTARVYFRTTSSGSPTNEPLTIRAVLYFESANGSFRRIITRNIGQFPT